jgi:uncharacterized protein (TIGR00159 family)
MELFRLGFLAFRLVDLLDVLLMATIGYQIYRVFRNSALLQLLIILALVFFLWRLVGVFDLILLKTFLGESIRIGSLALIVIFAPEIRRVLLSLAQNTLFERFRRQLSENLSLRENYDEIIAAMESMSASRTGAIILLVRSDDLSHIEQTGDLINADISRRLLLSIFNKTSPLHDGAVLINNNQISAVRCVLPISDDPNIPAEFGLRHRAAIGITEVSDAVALVVSEETGMMSIATEGKIRKNMNADSLRKFFEGMFQ